VFFFLLGADLALGATGCALFEGLGADDDVQGPDGGLGSGCRSNHDCAGTFVCAGGTCQLEGSVGLGGPCWATRDCAAGLFCAPATTPEATAGLCAPAGAGGEDDPCTTTADCERGLTCRSFGFGGTCAVTGNADLGESCGEPTDCIAGLACGGDGTCKSPQDAFPPFLGVECAPDEAPFRAFFEVPRVGNPPADFFRLPFPSDVRTSAAGVLDLSDFPQPGPSVIGVDLVGLYVDALVADFAGFSAAAVITFRFSQRLDFSSTSGATITLASITPGAPDYADGLGFTFAYTTGRTLYNCQHRLTVRPNTASPLRAGQTYAVFFTNGVRAFEGGAPAVADADLTAVLAADRPVGDEDLGHAWDVHAPLRAYFVDQGIDSATIVGAAVFTVADITGRMERLAAAAAAEPPPVVEDLTLCEDGVVSPCDDGGDRVCGTVQGDTFEIHGRFRVPIFQEGDAPYALPENGGALHEVGGVVTKVRDEMVCFAMTVPKSPAPPGGWPLVVYGHGTGGSFKSFIESGVALALATASTPTVVLGFDGVVHGARTMGSARDAESLMFNIINPPAARDNNLQGAVDVLAALRLPAAGTLAVPGVGDVAFDASRVYYFGHSQGSNVGVPAVAVGAGAQAALFSGAGAFLTSSLLNKTSPVNVKEGLKFLLNDPDFDGSHPVMTLWQTYFDSSDTLHFAPLLFKRPPAGVASKHVFVTYGPGDTYSPPDSIAHLAKASGVHQAPVAIDDLKIPEVPRPVGLNVTGGDGVDRFGACFQYQATGYDGHFVATRDAGAIADWTAFFMSLIETGTPLVP
jgi:predicted esterase